MLRDLQFNVFGKRITELFTVTELDVLTSVDFYDGFFLAILEHLRGWGGGDKKIFFN